MGSPITLNTDHIAFADFVTGAQAVDRLLDEHFGRYARSFEINDTAGGRLTLSYAGDDPDKPIERMQALCDALGPYLADAIEVRMRYPADDDGSDFRFYAGPDAAAIEACRMRRCVERAHAALKDVISPQKLDAMFRCLLNDTGVEPAGLEVREAGLLHAADVIDSVGEPEIAVLVKRAAATIRETIDENAPDRQGQLQISPDLFRYTIQATLVSTVEGLEFDSLAEVGLQIASANGAGTWGVLTVESLKGEQAAEALREVNADPAEFLHPSIGMDAEPEDGDDGSVQVPRG